MQTNLLSLDLKELETLYNNKIESLKKMLLMNRGSREIERVMEQATLLATTIHQKNSVKIFAEGSEPLKKQRHVV